MKKLLTIFLSALLLTSLLAACGEDKTPADDDSLPPVEGNGDLGSDESEDEVTDVTSTDNIQAIYEALIATEDFPPMYEISSDELPEYFTVSADLFSEFKAAVAEEYPAIERIFIGKLSSPDNKSAATKALETAIASLEAEYIDYLPLEYEKAKKCNIEENGEYIFYIVCENIKEAVKTVNDSLSNI